MISIRAEISFDLLVRSRALFIDHFLKTLFEMTNHSFDLDQMGGMAAIEGLDFVGQIGLKGDFHVQVPVDQFGGLSIQTSVGGHKTIWETAALPADALKSAVPLLASLGLLFDGSKACIIQCGLGVSLISKAVGIKLAFYLGLNVSVPPTSNSLTTRFGNKGLAKRVLDGPIPKLPVAIDIAG